MTIFLIPQAGGVACDLQWRPPASGDPEIGWKLANLINHPLVEAANEKAYQAYLSSQPVLEGVGMAAEELPDFGGRMILYSGPPIAWKNMCGPVQGAIIGAILLEGWTNDVEAARKLAENGEVRFEPNHHHNAVGPMAGIISPSMPVWIVKNHEQGNRAYCNLNEGLGKVLRFGANAQDVIERLRWMTNVLGPMLKRVVEKLGGLELKPLMAQALHIGDEVHNRNVAASSLLLRKLIPAALQAEISNSNFSAVARFIAGNDHFFLNLSMAACKAMLDAASGVAYSSMVTAMARNEVMFGIRLSGLGER